MASTRLVKRAQSQSYRVGLFVLGGPVENVEWLDGHDANAPVKCDSLVLNAGLTTVIEKIGATVTDEGTGEPTARVVFRTSVGHGHPWYWHRVSLTPKDTQALTALQLRFTRPRWA